MGMAARASLDSVRHVPIWAIRGETDWHARNLPNQIAAQYHYFNVYSKRFPAGEIMLPGADARNHNVMWNYFIMFKKQ